MCAGFEEVAALSSMGRGPLPAWQRWLQSCPASTLFLAGELPSLREGDRNLFGRAMRRGYCSLAGFRLHQFTKRRMRTFITMPSARNINRTDDPP